MFSVVIIVACNFACIIDRCLCCIIIITYTHHVATTYLVTRMATSILIEPFDTLKVEWDSWSRHFDQWLKISPFAEGENAADKMRAAFCTFIGSDAFKLLCSLCAPKKPEECTYDTLKTKLHAQYAVKKLVLVKCYHFNNYKQTDGQSLTDYLAELHRLSATYDWTEPQIADNLRDKFVMSFKNECLLQQLLTKDHKKPL